MTMTDTITPLAPPVDASRAGVEWVVTPGLTPYQPSLDAMRERAGAIGRGEAGERVWLLEHPPLLTAGTSAREADLLDAGGLPIHRAGRGGQWTYHGPGQRIAYVMLDLGRPHGTVPARDIRAFVGGLEAWLIRALGRLGVEAWRRDGRVGLWVVDAASGRESKIAAIGVRVTRWVSLHGVALNVSPDLSHYDAIVPCGIAAHGVTSLAALGVDATLGEVDAALAAAWGEVFGATLLR